MTDDDSDGDGILDAFDSTIGHGGDFTTPEDTDSDGTPDFLDLDSDDDGLGDTAEAGQSLTGSDNNGDGIDDGVNASFADPDGDVNVTINDLENNTDNDPSDVDFRSVNIEANLVTVKTLLSGDATPDEGDIVTFQIEVTNNGGDDATGVFLNDLLPAGLTPTANNGTVSQGSYSAVNGIFGIGDIPVGGSATLILEGTVDVGQGGNTITNTTCLLYTSPSPRD